MSQTIVIAPLSEHAILILFVQLFLLLLTARGLGELVRRIGLPAVVGELLAGIVLGPSLFGALAPDLFRTVFPQLAGQYHLIEVVSWFGLLMLLIVTGFETDLELIASRARPAALVSTAGIVVPFLTGFGLGYVLPASLLAAGSDRFVFSLFVAVAMSISAIPVIAKVLIDIGAIHRDIGQITIAAGMIDDTIGWILLSVVAALARAGTADGGGATVIGAASETIVLLLLFLLAAFTIGNRFADGIIKWADTALGGDAGKITVLMILALGVGSITQYIGVEAVLGTFVVGLLVGQVKRFDHTTRHIFETMTLSVFAPIFFAMAGLRVDLTTVADPALFTAGVVVLGVATVGKFGGAFIGATAAGLSRWEGIAMGAGMNARGAIEIIVATVGLSIGVLSIQMYSIIVMVALVTSITAPPLLRATLSQTDLTEEEAERIERRTAGRRHFLETIDRVLYPTRCGPGFAVTSRCLGDIVRRRDIDVTCLYPKTTPENGTDRAKASRSRRLLDVGTRVATAVSFWRRERSVRSEPSDPNPAEQCFQQLTERLSRSDQSSGTVRTVTRPIPTNVSDCVLTEAQNRYDLLVLEMNESDRTSGVALPRTAIDRIYRRSPCPILAISARTGTQDDVDGAFPIRRIVLPTVGTQYSRRAAEVAFSIATERNAIVEIMHVVVPPKPEETLMEPDISDALDLGTAIVDREAALGRQMGAEVVTHVTVGERPETEILSRASAEGADMIVMGSEVRAVSHRAFLGHRVESVIENAPCPVAVVSSRQQNLPSE